MSRYALASLALILAACGLPPRPPYILARHKPDFDYTALQTYWWLPRKDSGDERINDEKLQGALEKEVDTVLAEKGYRRVKDKAKGQFAIGYLPIISIKQGQIVRWNRDVTLASPYYGGSYGRGWDVTYWPTVDAVKYEMGTLIIRFHDPKTKKAFWECRMMIEFEMDESQRSAWKRLRAGIRKMMDEFPPPLVK